MNQNPASPATGVAGASGEQKIFCAERAARRRQSHSGRWLLDFFGGPDCEPSKPEGFRVSMLPGSVIQPHFHPVDQFQVFMGSEGATYKRHPIGRYVVHYADAHITYGPFATAHEPMVFYTLRPARSAFAAFMPQDRHRLVRTTRRRNLEFDLTDSLAGFGSYDGPTVLETVFGPAPDGLAVSLLKVGVGKEGAVPAGPPRSQGAYVMPLAGSGECGGQRIQPGDVGWLDGGDAGPGVQASPVTGLCLLVMRFPGGGGGES